MIFLFKMELHTGLYPFVFECFIKSSESRQTSTMRGEDIFYLVFFEVEYGLLGLKAPALEMKSANYG